MRALVAILLSTIALCVNGQGNTSSPKFTEGIIYSKASFPGHPVEEILKRIDFNKGGIDNQYKALRETIANAPEVKDDQMYLMALALMPVFSKTFVTPETSLTQLLALGYEWHALFNHREGKGRIFLQTHDLTERGTINFPLPELRKIWEKDDVGEYEGEYSVKNSTETVMVAGFSCKKMTYIFSGTSRGPVVHSKIISTIPWKVTVWYSDELNPVINVQHPLYIKLNKAILKTEVEFDIEGKKKMVYEVTKIEPRKIEEEELKLPEFGEVINHQPNGQEALSLIIKVMMAAGQVTWK